MWCGPHPGFHGRRHRRCGGGQDPWGLGAVHEDIERSMEQAHRDQRAAHLRARRRARDARSAARRSVRGGQRGSCAAGACGPWWAWLIFPVFFVLPALGRLDPGAMWSGFWGGLLAPVEPLVAGFAGLMGMGTEEAGFVLFAAFLVNAAALAFALSRRSGRRGA